MKDFALSAFLADLRTLCAIDSGHFNAPGTAAVADFFESRYRALGLKTERRYYDNNDLAPFLTARNSEDEQIDVLFVAHMDTVFPVGTGAQWPLEVDADGLAHGPGCIDCKGGCLSLYYLLRQMLQTGDCRFRFCVAMNSDEERGSAYSRPYFEALAQKSRYCFVFEPGRPNEEFVSQRKGGANYIFKCHGISAHSGVEPEKGASAILELSRWVNELYKLNDFAAGTTVNVGRFDGGGDNGAVPDYAECTLSYRYLDASALDRLEALLQRMQAEPFDPRTHMEIIQKSLDNYGYILVADNMEEAIDTVNAIASEHMEIVTADPFHVMTKIRNAGAIFIGEYSSEPLGDYFAGPNHVLPTNGTAKFFSALSVDDFIKKSSIISYSREALEKVHKDIEQFAECEKLTAHANSIRVRFE